MNALSEKVNESAILITSDQVISCDGKIREKPENREECKSFLTSYSNGSLAKARK